MMDSQQPDDGEFPPNPFHSSPDNAVGEFQSAPEGSGAASGHPSDGGQQQPQQSLPMPVPPAPREEPDEFMDARSTSFAPADSGYVGSGAMDSAYSGEGGGGGGMTPMVSGGATGVGSQAEGQIDRGGLIANVQRCCSIDSYRKYFDVDTTDVRNRMMSSILACNVPDGFRHNVLGVNSAQGKGPDLYGPFWITTTLVFFLAVTSNMHSYIHTDASSFEADISHLVHALWVLYTYSFLLPSLLFVVFRCLAIQIPLMELVCLYGYSLVPYFPATVLCLIPVAWLEWLILLATTCVSCLLVLRNVAGPVLSSDVSQQKASPLLGCVMGFHLIFFLVLKLTFYHHKK